MEELSDPIGNLQQICSKLNWLFPIYKDLDEIAIESVDNGVKYGTKCILNNITTIGESTTTKKLSKRNSAIKMLEALNEHYRLCLIVYNLPIGTTERHVRSIFSDLHSISSLRILYDYKQINSVKIEIILSTIIDLILVLKYNGYSYQNRKLSIKCQPQLIKEPITLNDHIKSKNKSKKNRWSKLTNLNNDQSTMVESIVEKSESTYAKICQNIQIFNPKYRIDSIAFSNDGSHMTDDEKFDQIIHLLLEFIHEIKNIDQELYENSSSNDEKSIPNGIQKSKADQRVKSKNSSNKSKGYKNLKSAIEIDQNNNNPRLVSPIKNRFDALTIDDNNKEFDYRQSNGINGDEYDDDKYLTVEIMYKKFCIAKQKRMMRQNAKTTSLCDGLNAM